MLSKQAIDECRHKSAEVKNRALSRAREVEGRASSMFIEGIEFLRKASEKAESTMSVAAGAQAKVRRGGAHGGHILQIYMQAFATCK